VAAEICPCGCIMVWTKHGWLCLHCDLKRPKTQGGQHMKLEKLKLKLLRPASHYGFYEWVVIKGHGFYKGQAITPGSFFSIPKERFWMIGFR
jgi:hypothetical protein